MSDPAGDPVRQSDSRPAGTAGAVVGGQGRWIEVDHRRVWYEEAGNGPTLLLLHGGLATNEDWAAQWSGLAPHRRLVAPERQAHGHTPDRPGPLTYEQMATDTVAFCRRLELDHATVRHAEEFARRVPKGELAVIPGASHLAPIERPAIFNQLVLEFTGNPTPHTLMPFWRAGS